MGFDWLHRGAQNLAAPILVVIHGLNGSADDTYVRFLADIAARADETTARPAFRVAGYLMRGCGGLPLTSRRGYSAADTPDLAEALAAIKERFPSAPIVAAGFSLGANLLVKYLGEQGSNEKFLTAAASISNPFTLRLDGKVHGSSLSSIAYSRLLALKLRAYFHSHKLVLGLDPALASATSAARTMKDVDSDVAPRMLGFSSMQVGHPVA